MTPLAVALIAIAILVVLYNRFRLDILYAPAADSCRAAGDYANALRAGNIPMVRCLVEDLGQPVNAPLPAGGTHADHYPLALVAESCNLTLAKYLVLERGADPRNGHGEDTPAEIAQRCTGPGGQALQTFLETEARRIEPLRVGATVSPPRPATPIKEPIAIRAQDFVRGTNVALDACTPGPGILANALPCHAAPNAAEFDFSAKTGGAYRLEINYAADGPRPVRVLVNGRVVRDQALSETTRGPLNDDLRWIEVGAVTLNRGGNTIRLERDNVFPHIHDLRLIPMPD